jgi:hypothetical protein
LENLTFSRNIAILRCFIFLISAKGVIILTILDSVLKFLEKSIVYQLFHLLGIDNEPDRYVLDADPDPAK